MLDDLKRRKEHLTTQKNELETQLSDALTVLDNLVDGTESPRSVGEIVARQREASDFTAAIARLDTALEALDVDLTAAQAAAERAERLNTVEATARAAVAATESEQAAYDDLFHELEAVFGKLLAAAETGRRGRVGLRALLNQHARALPVLGAPGDFKPAQEAAARELNQEMRRRGVDLSQALEAEARLRGGAVLWPLIQDWQREQARKLEAAA